jgi:hypothetical protein
LSQVNNESVNESERMEMAEPQASSMSAERREAAALRYAAVGWPVFPVRPDGKEPLPGTSGFRDATTDPDKISWWWGKCPENNVGIATGAPGPDVLDIDNHGERGTGMPGYARLKAAGLTDGYSAMIRTPHNGIHLYYRGSGQGNGKLRDQHIDYRGKGGYVVAPPSTVDGHAYEVFTHRDSTQQFDWNAAKTLLVPEPARPARPVTPPGSSLDHLVGYVAGQHEGNRNDGLFWAGCRAAEAGDEQVMSALADAAAHTGLKDHEIARTLEPARKTAGRREPRPFAEHSAQREAGS